MGNYISLRYDLVEDLVQTLRDLSRLVIDMQDEINDIRKRQIDLEICVQQHIDTTLPYKCITSK